MAEKHIPKKLMMEKNECILSQVSENAHIHWNKVWFISERRERKVARDHIKIVNNYSNCHWNIMSTYIKRLMIIKLWWQRQWTFLTRNAFNPIVEYCSYLYNTRFFYPYFRYTS
jgi:hypothetical protein